MTDLTPEREAEIRALLTTAYWGMMRREVFMEAIQDLTRALDATRTQATADREAAKCWRVATVLLEKKQGWRIDETNWREDKYIAHKYQVVYGFGVSTRWSSGDTPEAAILAAAEAVLGADWDKEQP